MINNILGKLATTYNLEGLTAIFKKSYNRAKYKYLRSVHSNDKHFRNWSDLKDKYKGERVFLIGNGPSLNKTKLYYLKNEYTLCFNRFMMMTERLNWSPDFYMITDNLVLSDMVDEIEPVIKTVKSSFFPDIHFRGTHFRKKIKDNNNLYWLRQIHGQGFSTDLPDVYMGGSVIYEGFQVLRYLGFDEIYFIGVDMNFKIHDTAKEINGKQTDIVSEKDDDPNHFDPRYFGKNRKYHQPKDHVIAFIMKNLKYLSEVSERENMNIINAGIDSNVDYFPRKEFDDLFEYGEDEKTNLFNECFSGNTGYESVEEFKKQAKLLESKKQWREDLPDFYMTMDEGIELISKAVFSHLPLGPYDGHYFFVKRKG
jgi:hypothetical protein